MKLAQVVRDRFNEIAEWRSQGEPWLEIDRRFRAMGQNPGTNSVRTLYRMELARRSSPEREAALRWANSNYGAIKELLDQGHDWPAILILIPPDFDIDQGSSGFTRLVAEFKSIDRLYSSSDQVPSTATQKTPPPDTRTELAAEGTDVAELSSPVPLSDQVSKSVSDRLNATAVGRGKEKEKLTPHVCPFESGPELNQRLMDSARKRNELHQESLSLAEQEREAAKKLVSEASKEYDQLRVDFLYRFGDYRAKYSKLHLLSAKALECGAVEVVDAQTENAIMLQGYDRPDSIEGLEEVPEPLFIRENLTDGELGKIEEAYANDGLELEGRNAVVRLAEAVCMRGEYLFRLGWHEYDTLVRLEGDDFPSPTLCNANKWQIRSRAIELWPKLTGNEPVQPSEFERKRLTYRPDPELEKRGEWT